MLPKHLVLGALDVQLEEIELRMAQLCLERRQRAAGCLERGPATLQVVERVGHVGGVTRCMKETSLVASRDTVGEEPELLVAPRDLCPVLRRTRRRIERMNDAAEPLDQREIERCVLAEAAGVADPGGVDEADRDDVPTVFAAEALEPGLLLDAEPALEPAPLQA